MTTTRRLDWDALLNARDLGGLEAAGGRETRRGALVRTDNLAALTPRGREALLAYGVRTVVDLRLPWELDQEPNPFATPDGHGVAYHNRSFIDPAAEAPAQAMTLAEDYVSMLRRFAPQVAAVVSTVANAGDGGVLVHCAAGKDRTGLIVALLLGVLGVAPEVIADDYALSADSLRARDARWLADGPGERAEREAALARLRARPEVMLEVLAQVDAAYGGVEGYLLAAGVTPADLARLRDRLLAADGVAAAG